MWTDLLRKCPGLWPGIRKGSRLFCFVNYADMLKQVAKLVLETSGIIPWEFVRARLENRATPVRDPRHGQ